MSRTFFLSLLLVSFICAVQAQVTATNDAKASVNPDTLVPLINLVLAEGQPNNAEVYLTQNLGLGDKDVPIIQKGWKSSPDRMNHLAAVSTRNHDDVLIFLFNENVEGVCWLTSKSGQVRSTVAFSRSSHTSHVVANELDLKGFEREKQYLLQRVNAATHKRN